MPFCLFFQIVYFVNSGSEANELAIILARAYTKNTAILSLTNGYHGGTYQTMSMSGCGFHKYSSQHAPATFHVCK